ncbi:MAG TPA: AIPR family protein [Fibrobacteria bacterium]|nr:AIPR family protein [Fibrobacteria bacterium]
MELQEFLTQTKSDVRNRIDQRTLEGADPFPFEEEVFTGIAMEHMSEHGLCHDPEQLHFERKIGNATLKLSGYAFSEDGEQVDLFVSLYGGVEEIQIRPESDAKKSAEQCLRFLAECLEKGLQSKVDKSDPVYDFTCVLKDIFPKLDQVRIFVLTDSVIKSKTKRFQDRIVDGKTIKLEIMDIERLYHHCSEGRPRDEVIVDFREVSGGSVPCVYVSGGDSGFDYALAAIPGNALRFIYEKFGPRLLEANVRSFLSSTGKVNRGIRDTLRDAPERFIAYNNGIVLTVDEIVLEKNEAGGSGIVGLKGIQIVNGGQTTASIYFTHRKEPGIDLGKVFVPAKIVVLKSSVGEDEEDLIADISRFANSQTAVKASDLAANKTFHIELERLSKSVYCSDGTSRWFYERAAGSFKTLLLREGTTPAKLKSLKDSYPTTRRVNKTELAKYLVAWNQKPHQVGTGNQKNFEKFMSEIGDLVPDSTYYKHSIAKAILYRQVETIVRRTQIAAFQANVVAYLVSLLAKTSSDAINFDNIWINQDIPSALKERIRSLVPVVDRALQTTAKGRMISEWAKKPECWEEISSMKI